MSALSDATMSYAASRPAYEKVALECARVLKSACYQAGVPCAVTTRVKDLPSLLKKMIVKNKSYEQVSDKVGVRLTVAYARDHKRASSTVENALRVTKKDDKALLLSSRVFGYAATHFDAYLFQPDEMKEQIVEVQVHTPGMSLWAGLAHDLVYKAIRSPTRTTERGIHRLAAVAELIDAESRRIHMMIDRRKGASSDVLLTDLERHFYPLAQRDYDRELSFAVLEELHQLVPAAWRRRFGAELDGFVRRNQRLLTDLFEKYQNDDRHLLLSQPEILLVFMLLEEWNCPDLVDSGLV